MSVGSDADLVIFDPEKEGGAGLKGRQSKGDFNVFEGLELKGGVHAVVKDGSVVVLESGDKVRCTSDGGGRLGDVRRR